MLGKLYEDRSCGGYKKSFFPQQCPHVATQRVMRINKYSPCLTCLELS